MKFILALLFVGLAYGDDSDCHKQLVAVHDCVVKKHEQNKAADDAKIEQAKSDVSKCFTEAGCDAPDYTGNSGMGGQLKKQWDNQPEAVKECIKKSFKTAMLEKLNECLAKNGVKQIQPSESDDHDVFGDRNQADADSMAKILIGVLTAVKTCQKNHNDKTKQVLQCIEPIKDKIKADVCKRVGDCKAEVKISGECKKRGEDIKQAVCKCKVDKLKEARTKIEALQKKDGDVTMDDLKDVHGGMGGGGGGQDGMGGMDLDKVQQCYKDNNANPPAILSIVQNMQKGGNGGGLLGLFKQQAPKVTKEQLQDMHDHIDHQIQNPDCGC